MEFTRHPLFPPPLEEVAEVLAAALPDNYTTSSATVVDCPDLRNEPFKVACAGVLGAETAADIGGQLNLFPQPRPDRQYSLIECARNMRLPEQGGAILGASAEPAHVHGTPSELAPRLSWKSSFDNVHNLTRSVRLSCDRPNHEPTVSCPASGSTDCALMMNLYGSHGFPGPVIKVTAKSRKGDVVSFTDFMRLTLRKNFGQDRQVSLGGVFVMKKGRAKYHVMPPFPPASELPFKSHAALDGWLSYHNFDGPMVCLTILHSADPEKIGVRLEHTYCFSNERDEAWRQSLEALWCISAQIYLDWMGPIKWHF